MLIDWFTVGAQALNFLILVWLMKRFLYKPILKAIDAREARIAAELADADQRKADAKKDRDEYQKKNDEFDKQRAALLTIATHAAKKEHDRLFDEARKAADAMAAKRRDSLQSESKQLSQAIARRTQSEVFAIARKALTDLAGAGLEDRMVGEFTRRLRELNGDVKDKLGHALKANGEPARLSSALALPEQQRADIQKAINETFSADIHLQFATAPNLVSGIELTANGQKLAWSISDYLSSLQISVDALIDGQHKSDVVVETKSDKPKPEPAKA